MVHSPTLQRGMPGIYTLRLNPYSGCLQAAQDVELQQLMQRLGGLLATDLQGCGEAGSSIRAECAGCASLGTIRHPLSEGEGE